MATNTDQNPPKAPEFQAGGTIRPGSLYVRREADNILFNKLLEGTFCYVLAPRQMGKSSLRKKLRKDWNKME